jgi:23S rRNA pseudouridine955/2504/2580 synthase
MSPAEFAKNTDSMVQSARIVDVGEAVGQRIDNFIVRILKDVPKSRIYRMIRKGEVRVNGGRIKPTYRLQPGDQVRIPPHRARPAGQPAFMGSAQLNRIEQAIIHEDDRLLVLNKPAGLAVHGGSGVSFGAIEALRRLRPDQSLELAHRLDRDTSGCLLIAKKRSALRQLHERFRDGTLTKTYTLIAHGAWPEKQRPIALPLTKYLTHSGERRVRTDPQGKPSKTTFRIQAQAPGGGATLLSAELHTGRTHQIRVHACATGHSIFGDEKYASPAELAADRGLGIQRLCLHASRVGIPDGDSLQTFECPLPAAFSAAWKTLEQV